MRLVRVFFGIRLFQVYNRTRFFSLQEVITVSRVITEFESKVERDIKRFKSDLHLTTDRFMYIKNDNVYTKLRGGSDVWKVDSRPI